MQNKINNFKEAEDFLSAIPQFTGKGTGFDYGLQRARLLCNELGNPEKNLKVIHVAGSNGKGSVCAMLDICLRSLGFKAGLFTSPHLKNIRERIRIKGRMISEEDFADKLNLVAEAAFALKSEYKDFETAYFEYIFAVSLLYFQEQKADVVIMETGLGGRLDATNIFENPLISVITPVSLEHTGILGNSLKEIAAEKAGIIKEGAPALVTAESAEALEVFKESAAHKNSRLIIYENESVSVNVINDENIDFSLHNGYYGNVTVSLPMPAIYEAKNAGLALTALAVIAEDGRFDGLDSDRLFSGLPKILKALKGFKWQGRMEKTGRGIYADGAHNKAGMLVFLESVRAFASDKRNVLLFAVSDDKNISEMVRLICESALFSDVVVTSFSNPRSTDAGGLKSLFEQFGYANVMSADDVASAFKMAKEIEHDYVFCTGSLFLVGELPEEEL